MLDLVCEDCNEFAVDFKVNDHDHSIIEFWCRNCKAYWIEPAEEGLVNECHA